MIGESNHSDKKDIRSGKPRNLGLKIFSGIIVSILIIITVYISTVKHKHQQKLTQISQAYDRLQKRNETIEKTKLQRVKFFQEQEFMIFPVKVGFRAANFIRKLSLITPEAVSLKELHLDMKNRSLFFCLKGLIAGASDYDKERLFAGFYRQLESFDDLMQVSFSKQLTDSLGPKYSGFTLSGELEIE